MMYFENKMYGERSIGTGGRARAGRLIIMTYSLTRDTYTKARQVVCSGSCQVWPNMRIETRAERLDKAANQLTDKTLR